MKSIKFKTVEIRVICANGESHEYMTNNEYKQYNEDETADLFNLTPFYMATELDEVSTTFKSFNTYNWNAPFTFCGVKPEDIYEGVAIVNIHLGGDSRGNYSKPYICEEVDALISQQSMLFIELDNGESFRFDCDNGEGYFSFDTFDAYYIDFEIKLTKEQYNELKDKQYV
jgi:hypothetical protein